MDLSKLPKLSGERKDEQQGGKLEPSPVLPASEQRPTPMAYRAEDSSAGLAADVWLSLVVGGFLMWLGWSFARWLMGYDSDVIWKTGPNAGKTVPYWQITGHEALSESAMFLFGAVMVLQSIAMLLAYRRPAIARPVTLVALLLTAAMTLYNLLAMVVLMRDGIAPLISMFAVAYGGFVLISQWKTIQRA